MLFELRIDTHLDALKIFQIWILITHRKKGDGYLPKVDILKKLWFIIPISPAQCFLIRKKLKKFVAINKRKKSCQRWKILVKKLLSRTRKIRKWWWSESLTRFDQPKKKKNNKKQKPNQNASKEKNPNLKKVNSLKLQ